MFLGLTRHIPLLGALFSFPFHISCKAAREVGFLWLISSLPILFSIVLSISTGSDLITASVDQVNIKVLFVYTAAFLAPVLYLFVDRAIDTKSLKIFPGSTWVFASTIIILLLTSWAYQNDKIKEVSVLWRNISYGMYVLSIYFWFLSVADDRHTGYNFSAEENAAETAFAEKAAKKDRK